MARILAFDYGTKRIGIAVTDNLQMIASGLKTVHSAELVDFLKQYLVNEKVSDFVIGEPKHLDGTASGPQKSLTIFRQTLKKNFPDITIHNLDERFTSKIASETMISSGLTKKQRRNKDLVDEISATIILQDFLTMRAGKIA